MYRYYVYINKSIFFKRMKQINKIKIQYYSTRLKTIVRYWRIVDKTERKHKGKRRIKKKEKKRKKKVQIQE